MMDMPVMKMLVWTVRVAGGWLGQGMRDDAGYDAGIHLKDGSDLHSVWGETDCRVRLG